MRRLFPLAVVSALLLSGCATAAPTVSPTPGGSTPTVTQEQPGRPAHRSVSIGFESLVPDPSLLPQLATHLDTVGANAVAISAGRVEWTAAPWPAQPEYQSSNVTRTGRDFIKEAVDKVGQDREVTLVVDVLAPRHILDDPKNGARDAQGDRSESLPSVHALDGRYGDLAVAWIDELAKRYQPQAISLTELFIEDPSLSDDERVAALTRFVARCAKAAHARGVRLTVDVRANDKDPTAGRRDSGQDYDELLKIADGLTVWAYSGISNADGTNGDVGSLSKALHDRYGDKVEVSVGLWGDGDHVVSAEDFSTMVTDVGKAGTARINVTPASLMTPGHWQVLGRVWS